MDHLHAVNEIPISDEGKAFIGADTDGQKALMGVPAVEAQSADNAAAIADLQSHNGELSRHSVAAEEPTQAPHNTPQELATSQAVTLDLESPATVEVSVHCSFEVADGDAATVYINDGTTDHAFDALTGSGANRFHSFAQVLTLSLPAGETVLTPKFSSSSDAAQARFRRRTFVVRKI